MSMKPRHILVVEDDLATRDALADILRRAGFIVSTWEGDAGLEAVCAGRRFQAAVVDFHLPFRTGVEVAQKLKELQPDCRILLISAKLHNPGEHAAAEAVDRFLAKPFSKEVFLETISQLCLVDKP
jgi:CheY-like chemotaxis protein